jgi:ferredoxin-type protein NapG
MPEEPHIPPGDDRVPDEVDSAPIGRRHFVGATLAAAIGAGGFLFQRRRGRAKSLVLRPPGALPAGEFEDACARCFKCGGACPNDCISFHGLGAGPAKAFTPYIKARTRGCILCGECARVCPSGALKPFDVNREGWLAGVDMGKARLNKGLCYSYHGRTCGACYRACPLAGQALKIGVFETPILNPEACVGCGLCEQACLHLPQAIRVIPTEKLG